MKIEQETRMRDGSVAEDPRLGPVNAGALEFLQQSFDHVGRGQDRLEARCGVGEVLLDQRLDHRLFAGEVVVEVARADLGCGADVGRAGAMKSAPDEARQGRPENLSALLLVLDRIDLSHAASSRRPNSCRIRSYAQLLVI